MNEIESGELELWLVSFYTHYDFGKFPAWSLGGGKEKHLQNRGPIKNFQECIQTDAKKGWKADKMCVQSEINVFGNITIAIW